MTDPHNLLPGLHEAMRLLKQNDLDYGPGRILERIKELGGTVYEPKPQDYWLVVASNGLIVEAFYQKPLECGSLGTHIIHCREVES